MAVAALWETLKHASEVSLATFFTLLALAVAAAFYHVVSGFFQAPPPPPPRSRDADVDPLPPPVQLGGYDGSDPKKPLLMAIKGTTIYDVSQSCSRHPEVKWAQRLDKVYLTVELPDAKNVKVNLEPDGIFSFTATAGSENSIYELKMDLFDKVNVEESRINTGARNILCVVEKAEKVWWKKLLRGDDKTPHYVKVDWDKWVDYDDDNDGNDNLDLGGMDFSNFGKTGGMCEGMDGGFGDSDDEDNDNYLDLGGMDFSNFGNTGGMCEGMDGGFDDSDDEASGRWGALRRRWRREECSNAGSRDGGGDTGGESRGGGGGTGGGAGVVSEVGVGAEGAALEVGVGAASETGAGAEGAALEAGAGAEGAVPEVEQGRRGREQRMRGRHRRRSKGGRGNAGTGGSRVGGGRAS